MSIFGACAWVAPPAAPCDVGPHAGTANAMASSAAADFMGRFYPSYATFVSSAFFVVKYSMPDAPPLGGIIMGSKSDWDTMQHADEMLTRFGVPHESKVVSAHRTPALMAEYASGAVSRGLEVIIAGAGGAAHL